MEFGLDTVLCVPPGMLRYERDEWTLFYDPGNHSLVRANAQGVSVVEAVARHPRIGDAVEYLARCYNLPIDEVQQPVLAFTADLVNTGLLHVGSYRKRTITTDESTPPGNIYIQNTERCNMGCVYCYNHEERKFFVNEHHEMDTAQLKEAIDKIADYDIKQVNFCGGEPTLRDDLLETAAHAQQRGRLVTLVTNGRAANRQLWIDAAHLFDVVWVSLDSHIPELNELHRGSGSYEPTLETIKTLAAETERRAVLLVSAVVSDQTWQQLPDLKRFCLEELGVDRFRMTSYSPGCSPWMCNDWVLQPPPFVSDPAVPVPDQIDVSELGDLFEYQLKAKYDSHARTLVPQLEMRNHCGAARGGMAMLSNGDIYPCQLLCKPQFLAGNIFTHQLEEIYQSAVFQRLRRLSVDQLPGCATCDVKYICGGGCRATALECYGSVEAHNTYFCDYQRRLCLDVLWYDSTIPVQQVSEAREQFLAKKAEIEEQVRRGEKVR